MPSQKTKNGKISFAPLAPGLRDSISQSNAGKTPLGSDQNEARGAGRFKVRIVRYGVRLLDVDNFCGGCKAIIDALRYEQIIFNDDASSVEIIFEQRKVKRKDIGTEIIIEKTI